MNILELRDGTKKVEVAGSITELTNPSEIKSKTSEQILHKQSATLEDPTGHIALTLWNEDVGKYRVGDVVIIKNGYVTAYQGKLQLQAGIYGEIVLVSSEPKKQPVKVLEPKGFTDEPYLLTVATALEFRVEENRAIIVALEHANVGLVQLAKDCRSHLQ